MNTADVHSAGAPPKKKRALPFKRTAPRKPSVDPDEDNDLDLFRHSKEVFPEILREVEEEIAERARMTTPENNHRKRRNSSPDEGNGEAQKRPSFSDSRQPEASRKSLAVNDSDEDDCILDIKGKGKEIVRPSRIVTPRKTRSSPTATASPTIEVISNRNEEFIPAKTPYRKEISSSQHTTRGSGLKEEEDTDSDIEEVESWEPTPVEETWDEHQVWIQKAREVQARAQDAITYVLVSSIIPGTSPVFLRRRLRQDMQVIIDTWADKQRANGIEFGADKQKLFLTWKGFKIYNKSSLASLGVKVNDEGEVKYGQGEGWYSWRRQPAMHLEIWTEDAYTEWEKAKEHERALRYGIIDDEDSDTGSLQEQAPAPTKKGIKVVLKAKDLEPMKSLVQEDTTVEFMIEAFRQQRDLDEEWDVAIFFDGERLDEDSLVKDADIDPDESNQFEVHVKKRG